MPEQPNLFGTEGDKSKESLTMQAQLIAEGMIKELPDNTWTVTEKGEEFVGGILLNLTPKERMMLNLWYVQELSG